MNKTVTFNLNGLVFTIEEDGYALLKQYLDTVKAYFGRQADGLEIVSEIEARIAEKFRHALDAAGRQVLYVADVNQLITEMGTVDDFEAFEAEEQPEKSFYEAPHSGSSGPSRLFRTSYNRILAGVANGLAVYLKVDVSLVRLLFILSTIFLAGFGLILYLVLWIAVPESADMTEPRSGDRLRKRARLYRDGDDKVLGGVSAGIAAYLNIDPLAVRLTFIIATLWGGFGVLAYLLLWIAMPAARSLAQKVEMRGQEANLANMKEARLPKDERKQKSGFARLLALPVDLLRVFARGIELIFRSLSGILRIFSGGFFIFFSAVVLFTLVTMLSVMVAYFAGYIETAEIPFPLEALSGSVVTDVFIAILAFLLILIPMLYLLYLGVRLLLNRKLFRRPVIIMGAWAWTGVVILSFIMATKTALEFQSEASVSQEQKYLLEKEEVLEFLPMPDDLRENLEVVRTAWYASQSDSEIIIKKRIHSRGATTEEARQHATMVDFEIVKSDTLVNLARGIEFKPGARYRGQHVEVEFYIPKNRPVRIHNRYYWDNEIVNHRTIELGKVETFILTDEGLSCLSCKPRIIEEEDDEDLAPRPTAPNAPATL